MMKLLALFLLTAYVNAEWFEESYARFQNHEGKKFQTQYHKQFAGWSLEKVQGMMGTILDVPDHIVNQLELKGDDTNQLDIPTSFSCATKWPKCASTFGYIKDQAACGSCWAVAASSTMGGRVCIAQGGPDPNVNTPNSGRNLNEPVPPMDFSGQQIMSCCSWCGQGCNGGYPHSAMLYIQDTGVVTGGWFNSQCGCYPYEIDPTSHTEGPTPKCSGGWLGKKCTNSNYGTSFGDDKHKASSAYRLSSSASALQNEIMNYGPIECGFSVYENFMHYSGGVYDHKEGKLLGGHAVTIYGWGVQDGTPYWTIHNSWNTTWGLQGKFLFKRGVNLCGMESQCVACKFNKLDSSSASWGLKC